MAKPHLGMLLALSLIGTLIAGSQAAGQPARQDAPAIGDNRAGRAARNPNPDDLTYPGRAAQAFQQSGIPAPTLLWPNGAPNAKGDSDEDKPAIYPFLPAKDQNTGCAVIVAPGGAFTHRAMDQEGVTFGKWFAARGIAAFVLRYRIQPLYGRPDYTLDGQRAVQFVKAHAADYGISPDRVGMIGFSAGSSLATFLACQPLAAKADAEDVVERQSGRIAFMILAYGSSPPNATVNLRELPPTFMYATEEDRRTASAMLSLYRTLVDAGVPAEMHVFPNGEHGGGLAAGDRQIGEWPNLMYRWLQAGNFLSAEPRAGVHGHILLDGRPLPHGSVTFVPVDDKPAGSHAPRTAFVMNTDTPTADFKLDANVGLAVGRYKVEVRQDAAVWVSNNRDPTRANSMSPAEKAAFIRTPGWGLPTIDGTIRLYTKAHPGDTRDLEVEIKPGENEFNLAVSDK